MKTNCTRRTGFMALKLDMSKAYDKGGMDFSRESVVEDGFS